MAFSWLCPYCNHNATITDSNFSESKHYFDKANKLGDLCVLTTVVTCPNTACKEFEIKAGLFKAQYSEYSGRYSISDENHILKWQLKPNSSAKQFPDYIPNAILNDYNEACLIRDLSPKASATLSRRCLQGMIRDFYGEVKSTLFLEIKAIEAKVDPTTWQAIDAVRKIGNIGAHMEKDINLIVDVDPQEAQMLIGLIEMLINDWYVARHKRQKQLEALIGLDQQKSEAKKPIDKEN